METKTDAATAGDSSPASCSPVRITLSRERGWKMPPNTVKVDRSTKFGNPYRAGVAGYNCLRGSHMPETTEEAVAMFREDLKPLDIAIIKAELAGKNLACWCKQGAPCHADVLLDLANTKSSEAQPSDR